MDQKKTPGEEKLITMPKKMYCPIKTILTGNIFGHNDYRGAAYKPKYLTSAKCISETARMLRISLTDFNLFYEKYMHFKVFIDDLVAMDKIMDKKAIKDKLVRVVDLRVPVEDKVKDLEVHINYKNVDLNMKTGRPA